MKAKAPNESAFGLPEGYQREFITVDGMMIMIARPIGGGTPVLTRNKNQWVETSLPPGWKPANFKP